MCGTTHFDIHDIFLNNILLHSIYIIIKFLIRVRKLNK